MSPSVTVSLPSRQTVGRTALWVGAVVVVLLAGLAFGRLVGSGPVSRLSGGGGLYEVHLASGSVYLGFIASETDGYLRLSAPAAVVPDSEDSTGSRFLVQLLDGDPYDIGGDALIPTEQVALIGVVGADSGLAAAYRQASGQAPGGTDAASPSPSPTP